MKFLHVGDLHIGRTINQKSLLEDQKYALSQLVDVMKTESISKLIISGDLFDKPIPSNEAICVLNNFLHELINVLNYNVFIISGNHDSSERLNFVSSILKGKGLYIDSMPTLKMTKYEINDEYGTLNVYMLPFFTPSFVRINTGNDQIKSFQDAIVEVLKLNPINTHQRNILITHHLVLNNGSSQRSDSETLISVGGIDQIDYQIFNDFDYVALGHLHHPQHVGRDCVRYSGSLLKYSESEIDQEKYFTIVDLKDKNNVLIQKIPIRPLREFKRLKGYLENLVQNIHVIDEDYVVVELEDKTNVLNVMERLRTKYPNCLQVTYTSDLHNQKELNKLSEDFHLKNPYEQFTEFYYSITNKTLKDNQINILFEVIEKATKL